MLFRTGAMMMAAVCGWASGEDIPLDFNWNGLAHEAEVFEADADGPDGYRSIGDRGLILGTPDSLGEATGEVFGVYGFYQLVMGPDVPDCVFVGRRGNTPVWDNAPDGDTIGVAPDWDPTGGSGTLLTATTTFPAPIPMSFGSDVSILYTASRGGGDFDIRLNFTDSTSVTVSVNAPDWFANFDPSPPPPAAGVEWQYTLAGPLSGGDGFAGAKAFDAGVSGEPLSVCEAVITTSSLNSGLGFNMNGKSLASITFDATDFNLFNPNAALSVFALLVNGQPAALANNWNGMIQGAELNASDVNDPNGYRSIGDRGLTVDDVDALGGGEGEVITASHTYHLAPAPGVVDTVMIGRRSRVLDDVVDTDDFGVPPAWDVTGGTGEIPSWTSGVGAPITMNDQSSLGFLYHASEGGGNFTITLEFTDASSVTVSVHAPDWFADFNPVVNAPSAGVASQQKLAGPLSAGDGFAATSTTDLAVRGEPLSVFEAVVTAGSLMSGLGFDVTGRTLEFITFESGFTGFQAAGIYAAAYSGGEDECTADVNNDGIIDFFDVQQVLNWYSAGDPRADFAADGVLDFFDIQAYLNLYSAGC